MPTIWRYSSHRFLSLLVLCLIAQCAPADSSTYRQSVTVGQDGNPFLRLTNDSEVPITAFIMVEFPSLGMEGRTYFDSYINSREEPIAPGASITRGLSSFRGLDAHKVRAEVRGVIFKDGSSAGDPIWINAILARRVRLHDRFLSIHDMLRQRVGTGISREEILDLLRTAQADAEKNLPDDDLRVMDTVVFYGAISTFDKNRQARVDVVLKVYLKTLERRMLLLEYSRPDLDTIRTLPITTPEPLSEASLPADFRASVARFNAAATATPSVSYCSVLSANFVPHPSIESQCAEGAVNRTFTFSTTFTRYNASTNQTTNVPWSSAPANAPYPAFGQCVQFVDCTGDTDVFYELGDQTGEGAANPIFINPATVQQGQNSKSFYWMLDDYPHPSFSLCDGCDLNPNGLEDPMSTNAPVSSTIWAFNYACVVSP